MELATRIAIVLVFADIFQSLPITYYSIPTKYVRT